MQYFFAGPVCSVLLSFKLLLVLNSYLNSKSSLSIDWCWERTTDLQDRNYMCREQIMTKMVFSYVTLTLPLGFRFKEKMTKRKWIKHNIINHHLDTTNQLDEFLLWYTNSSGFLRTLLVSRIPKFYFNDSTDDLLTSFNFLFYPI